MTRFGYDALGRRVWKATARLTVAALLAAGVGATAPAEAVAGAEPAADAWTRTAFVWSGDVLLAESDRADDALATVYAYEPGGFRPLAQARRDDAGADAAVYHYHLDHLGTPQELTDALGAVVWQAEYRAWGSVARERVAAVAQPLRFQGQYADGETGLHYNRFRYYSPSEGRFVTQDPIRILGGINVAEYAPNPVEWVDPFGLDRFTRTTYTAPSRGTGQTYTVYQQHVDWDLEVKGKTNLERASQGGTPFIEKNGRIEQMALHHSRQDARGSLFEVSRSTHQARAGVGREALHPYGNRQHPDYPVNRPRFDVDREQYWMDRAASERQARSAVPTGTGGCAF